MNHSFKCFKDSCCEHPCHDSCMAPCYPHTPATYPPPKPFGPPCCHPPYGAPTPPHCGCDTSNGSCFDEDNLYCRPTMCCSSTPCCNTCAPCQKLGCALDCYLNRCVMIYFKDTCIYVRILKICDNLIEAVLLHCGHTVYINCTRVCQIKIC